MQNKNPKLHPETQNRHIYRFTTLEDTWDMHCLLTSVVDNFYEIYLPREKQKMFLIPIVTCELMENSAFKKSTSNFQAHIPKTSNE